MLYAASRPMLARPFSIFSRSLLLCSLHLSLSSLKAPQQRTTTSIAMAARTGSTVSPSTGQLEAQKQTTTLSHMCHLDIDSMPEQYRKTSIICTIGPKTNSVAKLTELYHAGMSIVRMNFSHGSYEVRLS